MPHSALLVEDFLESGDIHRMDWPARSLDLNPTEHVWDVLGRAILFHSPEHHNQNRHFNFQVPDESEISISYVTECLSDLYLGRIVVYQDCGLSHRGIAGSVVRDPMTVCIIWNRWIKDGNTKHRAETLQPPIPRGREDRHVTRMVLIDCAAQPRVLSQELGRSLYDKCLYEKFDTFPTTWTLSSKIMAAATLDTEYQTGESSMV
ncbi:HTH_Tnp_Tc3_2 domain-containing protein [Trichonephila clavipes]|nr:HTH_Tnp_Tc3_2 domain-containing protein [Trichonephila clavipes]